MGDDELLAALKVDLQIATDKMDAYLGQLLSAARAYITTEGITLDGSVGDGMLVVMYAAYLYRRRREENVQMPRMLRWALNNRLFAEKAGTADG